LGDFTLPATRLLHILNKTNRSATDKFKSADDANQMATPKAATSAPVTRTTRYGHHVHVPARLNI
jgi:hypothetical protein